MSGNAPWIAVGVEWITVCNGLWHSVFLVNDRSPYPGGPCTCGRDDSNRTLIRNIAALLDGSSEGTRDESGWGGQQ
jgi:hypothetical protein